jgi:hypothetical protein
MKRLLLALGFILASCGGTPTEPADLAFQFHSEIIFGIRTLETSVAVKSWGVDVSGVFPTDLGYTLFGSLEMLSDNRLILTVKATKDREALAVRVQNYYVGRIINLPRGQYDLQVFETVSDSPVGPSELAFHGTFRVD